MLIIPLIQFRSISYFLQFLNTILMIIKKISILACIIISYNTVSSQTTTGASIQKDFGMISNLGKAQSGFESFQTYSAKDVNGSQFLPDTWSNGSVTTNTNITISSGY